jgi:hypothetical protein
VTTKYHGIMLDVHSWFQLTGSDRAFLKSYAAAFPVLKFVWNSKTDSLVATHSSLEGEISGVGEFVRKCRHLPGLAVRRAPRYPIVLNARIDGKPFNINNLSKQGCFIVTTSDAFQLGDEVSIAIKEFSDDTPILSLINRRIEWGSKGLAGIGVEFLVMNRLQQSEVEWVLEECTQKMEKALELNL